MKNILAVLLSGFIVSFAFAVKPEVSVSHHAIRYGEESKLTIKVPTTSPVTFPRLRDTLSKGLEILNNKIDTVKLDQGEAYINTISFSGYDEGGYTIPSYEVKVGDSVFQTQVFQIKVDSVAVNKEKGLQEPVKSIEKTPTVWTDYLGWILGVIVAIMVLFALYLYIKRKSKRVKHKQAIIRATSIEDLIRQLENSKYLENNKNKHFYTDLTDIVKEFIERVWNVSSTKMTTRDILFSLDLKSVDTETYAVVKEVLNVGDLVKFSKYTPAKEDSLTLLSKVKKLVKRYQV